jgi:hypothetical protein
LVSVIAVGACGGDAEPAADIKLDGSAREPDLAGLVTDVSLESIAIDGDEHDLSRKLLAFSTYNLTAIPVLSTEGAYVHAGVEDGKVTWVALVARPLKGARNEAFYDGTVRSVRGRVVRFADGTVLEVADAVAIPPAGSKILAVLDPKRDLVTGFRGA